MLHGSFEDIPWRRNEVEALHRFLLSARDRSFSLSPCGEATSDWSSGSPLVIGSWNGGRERGRGSSYGGSQLKSREGTRPCVPLHDYYNPTASSNNTVPTPSDDSNSTVRQRYANICILRGQTGCGKVSAVRRLCRAIGLKIIEYDPFEIDMVPYNGGFYEAVTESLLRFLDSARRRPGLRMKKSRIETRVVEALDTSNTTSRLIKRMKMAMGRINSYPQEEDISHGSNEPHIILVKDLPRTLLSCTNSDSVKRIQEVIENILEGSAYGGEVASYPLLICVNNTESDRLMLKSILPYNYEHHPRCLRVNVSQITKKKMKILLSRYLSETGRPQGSFTAQLVDYISGMSFGDIRFGMVNLHFYSTCTRDRRETAKPDLETLKEYMLERNVATNVFNLLGKVLVNKRVPVTLGATPQSLPETGSLRNNSSDLGSLCVERFNECFMMSRPVLRSMSPMSGPSLYNDYADVLEILPSISEDPGLMRTATIEFEERSQGADIEEALSNAACMSGYGMVHQPSFQGSLLGSTPKIVRMFGLTDPFDPSYPLSVCQWPHIEGDLTVTPTRYPRSVMLPRLTRPAMYYVPEELLDNGYVEGPFLVNCIFEHYVQYFDSIEDCAVLTTNLCFADVFATKSRFMVGYVEDNTDQLYRTFSSLCLRSVCDSNLGTSGNIVPTTASRHFGKSQWHSVSRFDMDTLKELYNGHLRELLSNTGRCGTSRNLGSVYTSKDRAFVEIVPFMHMLLSHDTGGDGSGTIQLETSINVSNIMTDSMLEKIDLLIGRSESIPVDQSTSSAITTGKASFSVMDSVTPKFRELISRISKHY